MGRKWGGINLWYLRNDDNIQWYFYPNITNMLLWACVMLSLPEPKHIDIREFIVYGCLGKEYSYYHWTNESKMIRRILAPAKVAEFDNTNLFWEHLAKYFATTYLVLWLIACFSMGIFTHLVILGTISLGATVTSVSMIMYCHNRLAVCIRDLLGGPVNGEDITMLVQMVERLDTDRLQFLLHDTLKGDSGEKVETIKLVIGMLPESINVADKGGALNLNQCRIKFNKNMSAPLF